MKDNTKVLKSVLDEQDKADDVELLLIVHMLPDTLTFLEQTGDVFNIDHILCIPYAVDEESLEQAAASFDVTVPSDIDDLRDRAKRYIQDFPEQHDTDLIVLEIGGYCADFINDIDTGHIRAIVEDTNNGHWAYEQADPDVPVLSIAQSSIKQLENRVVGPAVVFSLEKMLRTRFEDELAGSDVLVTGYGNIGSSTAAAAQGRNATVMVYDTDPRRSIEAALDGYHVRERERMLRQADIVIGTTGQQSVDIDDMRSMEGTVILASGSSKQREFDIERLRREASLKDSGSHWEEYQLDGTSIILLNGGKPVNFLDQSISMPILDMIFASLVTCIHEAVQHELQPGLQEPDQERLDSIAETWLHAYQYSGELQ